MSASASVLPPGPRLPATVQAWLMLRHGLRFVAASQRRYGPVFTHRIASMGTVVYDRSRRHQGGVLR